jgi:hypothetical protein
MLLIALWGRCFPLLGRSVLFSGVTTGAVRARLGGRDSDGVAVARFRRSSGRLSGPAITASVPISPARSCHRGPSGMALRVVAELASGWANCARVRRGWGPDGDGFRLGRGIALVARDDDLPRQDPSARDQPDQHSLADHRRSYRVRNHRGDLPEATGKPTTGPARAHAGRR